MNATLLTRAAEILEREAATLFESYTVVSRSELGSRIVDWSDAQAMLDHEEMVRVAGELRKEAA